MEKHRTLIKGKAIVLRDPQAGRIDDIDTDMIFHNAHLAIVDINQMGQYALGNLEGFKDFPSRVKGGEILVVGRNFGSGSSRQQAVDCFKALGISLIVGESFGAIYKRNAINSGFPLFTCSNICSVGSDSEQYSISDGDTIEVDLLTGKVFNATRSSNIQGGVPFSQVQMDIYRAGNLFAYARQSNN